MPDRNAVDWTLAGLEQEARCVALDALTAVLASDRRFLDACEAVRRGELSIADVARRGARRQGRGRAVLSHLLDFDERAISIAVDCGASERAAIGQALINRGRSALWLEAADADVHGGRWRRDGTRFEEASQMLVARMTLRCMSPGCNQSIDQSRLYCSAHAGRAALNQRADQEAIRHLLDRCADALEV